MTKPLITKRSVKGSPLTYSELDTNFDNLRDATVSLRAGSAGTTVSSDLNGVITLVAGSGISLSGDNTAKTVTITNTGAGGSYYNNGNKSTSTFQANFNNGSVQKVNLTANTVTIQQPSNMSAGDELILLATQSSISSNSTVNFSGMIISNNADQNYFESSNSLTFLSGSGNLQLRIIYDGSQYWTTLTTNYV